MDQQPEMVVVDLGSRRAEDREVPLGADQQLLLEHRAAVRANVPRQVESLAEAATHTVGSATYATLEVPDDVLEGVAAFVAWSAKLAAEVARDEHAREQAGVSVARWQWRRERATRRLQPPLVTRPHDWPGGEPGS